MPRKLTLELEKLSVSSFATQAARPDARGTVNAHVKVPCNTFTSCPATYHTCASFDRTC